MTISRRNAARSPGGGPKVRPTRVLPAMLREILTFGAIGVVSTLAYVVIYSLLRDGVGAPIANALALIITAIGNTAANRRLTFGVRGQTSMVRDQVGGLVAFGIALLITSASIGVLAAVAPEAGRVLELGVLVAANAAATITRFFLLRAWISHSARASLHSAVKPDGTPRTTTTDEGTHGGQLPWPHSHA